MDPCQLDLAFALDRRGRTRLERKRARYPYVVMTTLPGDGPAAGAAKVIIQSGSGGLFADERLGAVFEARARSCAQVLTQGATVVHSMAGAREARQRVEITVHPGARLDYVPKPVILFPASRLRQELDVCLHDGASAWVAEGFLSHDPEGAGGHFAVYENRVSVSGPDGRLLATDRMEIAGKAVARGAPGISGDARAFATLYLLSRAQDKPPAEVLRRVLPAAPIMAGLSALPNDIGLLVRLAAPEGGLLADAMDRLIAALRRAEPAIPFAR